eukprot:TRINITY_DN16681_c0_g1_i1.p1 TRINITY_DN16681_c0_g1~~TRINITY_DN16681_c0_g1_i1.p1  ORF type:complete len:396 (+),score=69.00 TRINITY_DN16681_c0_g1_i1:174-1361(+)
MPYPSSMLDNASGTSGWERPRRVAITGVMGNVGWKLVSQLCCSDDIEHVYGLDINTQITVKHKRSVPADFPWDKLSLVQCDLRTYQHDAEWARVLDEQVDAVIQLAAENPFPDATWQEAAFSLSINNNVLQAAADSRACRRVIFASSNHVCGKYKDPPLSEKIGFYCDGGKGNGNGNGNGKGGELRPTMEPAVGTVYWSGFDDMDATPYASVKLAGERTCISLSEREMSPSNPFPTSFVCVRIGWCQPGPNLPSTLSASGIPPEATEQTDPSSSSSSSAPSPSSTPSSSPPSSPPPSSTLSANDTMSTDTKPTSPQRDLNRTERWFKQMWLANEDMLHLMDCSLNTDPKHWNGKLCVVVNGMSNNEGMPWSLVDGKELIGYNPSCNVYDPLYCRR